MRICVFCASSDRVGETYRKAMRELGLEMGRRGHDLVFGGYDTGLMGETAHAVHDGGGLVHGVVPDDVSEFMVRHVFEADDLREVTSITSRKEIMKDLAEAFVAGPGSYGTLDELFEVLVEQKLAVDNAKPVCIYNVDGVYDWFIKRCNEMLEENLMPESDVALWQEAKTPSEVLDYIESFKGR